VVLAIRSIAEQDGLTLGLDELMGV